MLKSLRAKLSSLPPPTHSEFLTRRADIAARLPELKADALLVSSSANVRYLSGFDGSNGVMLLLAGESHFFTDPRYGTFARQNVPGAVHVAKGPLSDAVLKVIKRTRIKRIGFESGWTRFQEYASLKDKLPAGAELVPIGNVIEQRRMVKSPSEIARIRESVSVNSQAYDRAVQRIRPGVRELDIAAEIEYQMKVLGAEKPAFGTIIAAGQRSALPHAHPSSYRLQGNEILLIDMGTCLDGYASDMTRVIHLGKPPKKVRDLYNAVLEAQLAGIDAVRPGVSAAYVDRAARDVLKKHNLEKAFIHSTGHGLGLEIHEPPRLGKKDKTRLAAGMAITIEPGAYIEGFAGVRIEDTVLVTERGCEILTPTSKEFLAI